MEGGVNGQDYAQAFFLLQFGDLSSIYGGMEDKSMNSPELTEGLSRFHGGETGTAQKGASKSYSRFIRAMRIFLPLVALGIVGFLMIWPQVNDKFDTMPTEIALVQAVGKNELIKPRFESEDSKHQPFTVTADRAVQNESDPDEVLLEQPQADMVLNDGTWIAAQADEGRYRQESEHLVLEGDVKLFHDQGYEIVTTQLHVDVKHDKAWSETPISGHGPAGTLEATGMTARTDIGHLVFTGPAKLVLYREVKTQP